MLLPQRLDVEADEFGLFDDPSCLTLDRCIYHLPIHAPGASPQLLGPLLRNDNPHGPLDLLGAGREDLLHCGDLRRVDALLAVVAHALALVALALQGGVVGLVAVRRGHEIDGGGQVVGARGRGDGLARKQHLRQRGRARDAHVQRKVLGREHQALQQVRRRPADLAQVHDRPRRLDQRQHRDLSVCVQVLARPRVRQHVRDERQVAAALDLGHHQRRQVARLHHLFQIAQREARAHAVDAHGALFDARGDVLVEGFAHRVPRFGFVGGRDAVFEVVRDAVGGQGAGFVQEALRGAGDCFFW